MGVIKIEHLTKDYGNKRGVFDENIEIAKGEMMGFVGTNGSGKTTTIRNLMGFICPTSGKCYVNGLESWKNSSKISKLIGYVPGEIAFPDLKTGTDFLRGQAEFLKLKDMSYANELIERFQLDPSSNLKRMSKGMKQKTAIVAALMNDSEIIILDEPTTGLDPLMRVIFLDIIKEQHKKGKTILMSSHMFEEVQETCDRVALIRDGHILDIVNIKEIKNRPSRDFKIEFIAKTDYQKFVKSDFNIIRRQEKYNQVTLNIPKLDISKLFKVLKNYDVKYISEVKYTLEKHFKDTIQSDEK